MKKRRKWLVLLSRDCDSRAAERAGRHIAALLLAGYKVKVRLSDGKLRGETARTWIVDEDAAL